MFRDSVVRIRRMQFREPRCCIALAQQWNALSTRSLVNTRDLELVLCPETERGSRTLQIQDESTEGRRVFRRVPDEPSVAGKILRLWHFGRGEDKRPNCREVLFPNLKAETAPARRPWPGKNRENCAECRNGRARSAIAVSRHQRKPDPDRPRARFSGITSKNFQLLQMWWNRRTCSWPMWRDQVEGVICARKSDTCRGFAVQSPQLTKGKARKEKKRNHPWKSAAWIRNMAQTILKTPQMTRVKNLYSPSTMVIVPSQSGNKRATKISFAIGKRKNKSCLFTEVGFHETRNPALIGQR